jgi:hypothetical protein
MKSKIRPAIILRWIAHAWSLASAALLFAFAFGGREHVRFTAGEAASFLLFPGGVVAGFAIAWRSELVGGMITIGSLAMFYLLRLVTVGLPPPGPYFLLFAAPGFLHVVVALRGSRFGEQHLFLRGHRGHSGDQACNRREFSRWSSK